MVTMLPMFAIGCTRPEIRDGPLQLPGGDAVVTIEAAVGQRVAYGYNVMTNRGTSSISNIDASLVPENGAQANGISFEPAVVVNIGAKGLDYLGAGVWPSEEWAKHAIPLEGYKLPPDTTGRVELLVVAKVDDAGQWFWPKTRVGYDYEGKHYVEEVTNGFSVCAPAPCVARTKPNS